MISIDSKKVLHCAVYLASVFLWIATIVVETKPFDNSAGVFPSDILSSGIRVSDDTTISVERFIYLPTCIHGV